MSNLLEDLNVVDELIRDMRKIESKLLNGQFIFAYREVGRLLAKFQKAREIIIQGKEDEK